MKNMKCTPSSARLVGDKQAERLDDDFEVKVDTEVSFVKLVPLVGG